MEGTELSFDLVTSHDVSRIRLGPLHRDFNPIGSGEREITLMIGPVKSSTGGQSMSDVVPAEKSNQNNRNGRGTGKGLPPLSSKASNRSSVHGYRTWGQYTPVGKERRARKTQIQYALDQPERIQPRRSSNQISQARVHKAFSYRNSFGLTFKGWQQLLFRIRSYQFSESPVQFPDRKGRLYPG